MSGLVVRARQVVLPDGIRPAAVHSGRIAAVTGFDDSPAAATTLADDEVLLPGLVDSHVHVNEPGRTHWEGFATATRAAIAGGVTTIVDMPLNSIPATTSVEALHVKRQSAKAQVAADVAFWGGAVPGNLDQLRPLLDAGVVGFKCFLLDSGVPEFPPLDDAGLRAALAELATVDGLLIAHAEDAAVIDAAPAPQGPSYAAFLASQNRILANLATDSDTILTPLARERRAVADQFAQSATVAEASRAHCERVESGEELPAALQRALHVIRRERRQAVLELRIAVSDRH